MTIYTKLLINGIQIDDAYNISLSKSSGDNNKSSDISFDFDNFNQKHVSDFDVGDEIIFYADKNVNPSTTKIFSGIVISKDFSGESTNERLRVQGRDYTSFLQNVTVEPEVYNNQEISLIVKDIMAKYASEITTTNVSVTSKIITRITFTHDSVFDAIKKLCEFVNYIFYVDENKDLHFEAKIGISSGLTFDSTNILESSVSNDVDDVKNKIFVYGAKQLVATPTESFIGTGTGSVFTLNFKPHNTSVQVNGVDQKGDLFLGSTSTPQSGINYLVSYNDKTIIFVSGNSLGNSIPKNGSTVTVDYQVSRQIIKVAEDDNSEVSYGTRSMIIQNDNITDPNEARDIAKNQLKLNKDPLKEVNLKIQGLINISAGTTALVNIVTENVLNETLDVIECTYDFNKENCYTEQVLRVKLSQRIADITDVLKDLLAKVKALESQKIDSEGIITRLLSFTGSIGIGISGWEVKSRYIGNGYILGHPINALLGSPAVGVNGQQLVLGWAGSDWGIIRSGT
jgi:hypothetical protein